MEQTPEPRKPRYILVVVGHGRSGDVAGRYTTHKGAALARALYKQDTPDIDYVIRRAA